MRLTALWWWIDRWRKSSAFMDMTLEEQGAYRNLLDEAHLRGGPLPNNERILAKACGDALAWPRLREVVLSRFELREDGWHNPTLDNVLHESTKRAEKQRNYRNRSHVAGNDAGNAGGNSKGSPSPSPSPSPDQDPVPGEKKEASLSPAASFKPKGKDPFIDSAITERAGRFLERYQESYLKHRKGARYALRDTRDYAAAVRLCQTWADERLDKLVVIFLTTDNKFAEEGSRTVPQFLALASWCDGKLAEYEAQKASAR